MWNDEKLPPRPFGNQVFGISHKRIGNFRDPMVTTYLGPLRVRNWNMGRCGVSEMGCWTPLGEITLSASESPDGNLPIKETHKMLFLRIGQRVAIRLHP